jgi:hypothetical protein
MNGSLMSQQEHRRSRWRFVATWAGWRGKTIAGIAALAVAAGNGTAFSQQQAVAPNTIVLDGTQLTQIRQALATNPTPEQTSALNQLTQRANSEVSTGPWSVMDKTQTPPSGDRHDYLSQAPYWWPTKPKTASNPQGCPYVQRDGQVNPDINKITDKAERALSWQAIYDLSLAWFYTGNAQYAQRAELDVRTWFLDPATRMNPNLNFAQGIPCSTPGRQEGIIESSELITQVLDALAVLDSGAPGWTTTDHSGIQTWMTQFLSWMRTSSLGKKETAATNNHGSWKDLQDAAIALYVGQTSLATSIASGAESKRIATQIKSDGSQPLELARTRPWHYSNFNATALCRLAETGRHVGVNLWSFTASKGGSLVKAVDFLIPAAEHGSSSWKFHDIDQPLDQSLALYELHAAADEAGDANAKAAIPHVPAPSGGDIWPLLPAC